MATAPRPNETADPPRPRRLPAAMGWSVAAAVCGLHGVAIWLGLGGLSGLRNGWPIGRDDHPLYFHSALVTRSFLRSTWTTAGYDPYFMSGYAKSVVFPASSTLPELVIALFGRDRPELAYKLYVLAAAALAPWLVAGASALLGAGPVGSAVAATMFAAYVWTDFPINYVGFGMLPYFLAIPLGLLATAAVARFLESGGFHRWELAAAMSALAVLVHLTSAMIVAPAAALAYGIAVVRRRELGGFPSSRHAGVWMVPVAVLGLNAFWWQPGPWLASTKGPSDFAFAHPEGVARRLLQIVTVEAPVQSLLIGLGLPGIAVMLARRPVRGVALAGFAAAGFAWGYLAGGLRALDFLQPGRHTYAFYTGLALASGLGVAEAFSALRPLPGRPAHWGLLGLVLVGSRVLGPGLIGSVGSRLGGPEPFLSSRPTPRLERIAGLVRRELKAGDRLLYEEGGFEVPGVPDPFAGGRFSGLIPYLTDFQVELIGGPYLHASLATNFTQFGEAKLFGRSDWDRDYFDRYARLYRPAAILCWSPTARAFCRANPDRVEILSDDGAVLFGRVKGFDGAAIEGKAEVRAEAGRLLVRPLAAGVDGSIVLRYHSVPCLRSRPPARWDSVSLEGDPVPFLRLRPTSAEAIELELVSPP